jgi:hypothetical protein
VGLFGYLVGLLFDEILKLLERCSTKSRSQYTVFREKGSL